MLLPALAIVLSAGLAAPQPAASSSASPALQQASDSPRIAVPFTSVSIGGSFWTPRLQAIRTATLEANRVQCEKTGRYANFDRAAALLQGKPDPGAFQGLLFNDSDVYKMMQGWAEVIATEPDPTRKAALDADLDALIARVAAAQHPDGYIDTYYTLKAGIAKRFTREEWDHETYCMGHLIEAAAVHARVTGKQNFLAIAIKAADFLRELYGPDKFSAPPGHQELEIALIELARVTGQSKYADFAQELVQYRGHPHRKLDGTTYGPWGDYCQDHLPAAEQFEAAGHAVRAGYLYSAMTDLAILGHREYIPALESLWTDITQRRIFVTGGIGPSGHNEGFTVPYDIPTKSAYQETCASIALCLWAHRMYLLEGDPEYMAQFERTLYNAALAGVSLNGAQFFYVNPLASDGGHLRKDWFDCACCPPNVLRFFAGLGQYLYAVKSNTLFVNLFADSRATIDVSGLPVELKVESEYPWGDGTISISATSKGASPVTLAVRALPGMESLHPDADGYIRVMIEPGKSVSKTFKADMTPTRVYSDPRVKATLGHAAILRGPLVYAVESVDNKGIDLSRVILPADASIMSRAVSGLPELTASVLVAPVESTGGLFSRAPEMTPASITLRPYFMWANRGDASMRVWLPESPQMIQRPPHPGIKATASHAYSGESADALLDGIVPDGPKGSADESIARLTFWPHKGTTEWVQYDFSKPRTISQTSAYWFDDTGKGGCRLPKGASLQYKSGDAWLPVPGAESIPTKGNVNNAARFAPITTSAVRLSIQLADGFSGGVLEWSVGP